jgi:hypothetical protein
MLKPAGFGQEWVRVPDGVRSGAIKPTACPSYLSPEEWAEKFGDARPPPSPRRR